MSKIKFTERQGAIMRQSKLKRPPFIRDGVGVIRLTRGAEAIVDIDMLPLVGNKNWYLSSRGKGHKGPLYTIGRGKDGKNVPLHREILRYHGVSIPKGMHVDHINRNSLDNRFANLRVATISENNINSDRCDKATGVFCNTELRNGKLRNKKYQARIRNGKKQISIGYFATEEEAHEAYIKAKQLREEGQL